MYAHAYQQFLQFTVRLGLGWLFVCFSCMPCCYWVVCLCCV